MAVLDQDLMRRIQAGDKASFAQIVDRFHPRLLRFACSSLRDTQLAEDVVQETFLAIYQARQTYNPAFAVSTWIWTILLNLVRNTRERIARRKERETASCVMRVPVSSCLPTEDREQLDHWLSQIPEAEADALRLRFFGELSFDQIAASMESSVSGAKVRVRNGLERLSELARMDANAPASGVISGEMS